MNRVERAVPIYLEQIVDLSAHIALRFFELSVVGRRTLAHLRGEIVGKGVGQNKITVGQALHECAGAEPVRAVIGKIRFADHKQSGHVAHQIVINPEPAHRVMDCGINSHRNPVGVFAGDLFVNFK